MTGAHIWEVWPGILQTTLDLSTGRTGPVTNIWNGTGGLAPEGPHLYQRDGDPYIYLLLAEGGTKENHMVTMARSQNVAGPYEPAPLNPLLTNANTSQYFQAVGQADLFQDRNDNWWALALAVRTGPEFTTFPMGRESVLTPVSWPVGNFPVFDPVRGHMNGPLPPSNQLPSQLGVGELVDANDHLTFPPNSTIPPHLLHWRLPIPSNYIVSPPGHTDSIELTASHLNLTGRDGFYTGGQGQTLLARRQSHSLLTFSVHLDYSDLANEEDEAGVTIFLVQRYHFDLGVVLLRPSEDSDELAPHLRFRGMSGSDANGTNVVPLPDTWKKDEPIKLQIQAFNETHYAFSAESVENSDNTADESLVLGYCTGAELSWGFTGTLLGIFTTTNGGKEGGFRAWFSEWIYTGQEQIRE